MEVLIDLAGSNAQSAFLTTAVKLMLLMLSTLAVVEERRRAHARGEAAARPGRKFVPEHDAARWLWEHGQGWAQASVLSTIAGVSSVCLSRQISPIKCQKCCNNKNEAKEATRPGQPHAPPRRRGSGAARRGPP
eukprot:4442582-Prymnesium_polylepis.1